MMSNSSPRTVLLISSNRWNSAITEYLISSATAYGSLGYQVEILAKAGSAAMKRLQSTGFNTHAITNFKLRNAWRIFNVVKLTNADLVITFGGPETTIVNFLPLKHVKRIRFRGQNFHDSWKFRAAHAISHFNFARFISPARWLSKKLKAATKKNYQTIDLGMDSKKFKHRPIAREALTLTLVARFDPVKGHRHFFKLLASAITAWPANLAKPTLRLIGREENITIPQLRAWGKEFGIEQYITIETEKLNCIEDDLNRTTLAVIPSLGSEVICRSAYEFLLCGCPIFVSGVGSLKETIQSPIFGHSYDGRNDEDTVELLLSCISDAFNETDDVRKMRAHEARKFYSVEKMAASLDKIST